MLVFFQGCGHYKNRQPYKRNSVIHNAGVCHDCQPRYGTRIKKVIQVTQQITFSSRATRLKFLVSRKIP